jgi:hypothetical protein
MQKPVLVAFVGLSLSSVASADGNLSQLDTNVVSAHCAKLAGVPELEGRISVASCAASEALDRVPRMAPAIATSVLADAAQPAIAMLDEVIAHARNEPRTAIIANSAKASIYAGMIVRARAMVPSMENATGTQLITLQEVHRDVEPELAPWVDRVEAAYSAIDVISRAHPELAQDPVIQTVVRESHMALDARP